MASLDAVRAMHTAVCTALGAVDILYANHGTLGQIIGRGGDIEDLRADEFENTWRVNTASSFLVRSRPARARAVLTARDGSSHSSVCRTWRAKNGAASSSARGARVRPSARANARHSRASAHSVASGACCARWPAHAR
jgi:NAD(P)-dependent dehydrogenase (short-subunit alcohol dehydrogenase family)